ncbi:ADP-ribosyltransferase [Hamadaea sp. NPDC051192]|uniref:ADP-ribosyltransferase n=1 Tax=Hamadaea sp. NPDC051192 TaxID=3154940 RepID=UPI00343ECE22
MTWEDLGSPKGPPPVGAVIGYEGGTYELLPGEPRRYRVTAADGRDISDQVWAAPDRNSAAEDARTALRMDAYDRAASEASIASGQMDAWDAIPGSWSYDDTTAGFGRARAAEKEPIRAALQRWATHGGQVDETRMAEPPVNRALRGAMPHNDETHADVAALDRALELSRIRKKITVYRGVSDGSHILPNDWQTRDLTGLAWSSPGYTPVTGNAATAEVYTGLPEDRGFAIRLHLPKGAAAVAIRDDPGAVDDEGEVVLPRGLTFRVIADHGVQGDHGIRWLDVEAAEPS